MRLRLRVIMLLGIISGSVIIVAAAGGLVYAQSCTATLGNPVIPTGYGGSSVPFVIPVSASCTTYYTQLYANGNAYDATSNVGLGTATTVLSPVDRGTQFTGQLGFSLGPTSPSDSVQVSVSIFENPSGNLITLTSETVQVGTGVQQPLQQITTITITQGQSPYGNPSPPAYQSPYPNESQYQYQPQYPSQYQSQYPQASRHHSYYFSQQFPYGSNNQDLFDWLVIVAIIAAVIIATVGLMLIARRPPPQPVWYPLPPPPPSR